MHKYTLFNVVFVEIISSTYKSVIRGVFLANYCTGKTTKAKQLRHTCRLINKVGCLSVTDKLSSITVYPHI